MKTTHAAIEPPAARYEQVKNHIRQIIESGGRQAGERLPSEQELVTTLGA
jgi:GntR family transcriptional regulator, histidine utilization repressor